MKIAVHYRMKHWILGILAAVVMSAFAPATIKTYNGKLYSFKFPDTWLVYRAPDSMQVDLFIYPPEDGDPSFNENINVLHRDLENHKVIMKDFVDQSKAEIKRMFPDVKFLSSEEKTGVQGKYHQIVYTAGYQGLPLKFKQHYLLKDGYAFVLTFTSTVSEYGKLIKDVDLIFGSFKKK